MTAIAIAIAILSIVVSGLFIWVVGLLAHRLKEHQDRISELRESLQALWKRVNGLAYGLDTVEHELKTVLKPKKGAKKNVRLN